LLKQISSHVLAKAIREAQKGNTFFSLPSGLLMSNAVVLLFPPPRAGHNGPGQPVAGTVANNAGAYTIKAPAGTYTLLVFKTNYVSNFKIAPVLIRFW
jgi:hypothetical protein